jgi:DNA-binding transcriptional MocR family regulator
MIIEDDPYWYLQFPSAAPSQAKARNLPPPLPLCATPPTSSGFPFLDSLVPSYLTLDTQGRVLRLDTFSKTVAPGCRLGYITAQPAIIERLLRITESSTQQPSGFAQSLVAELLIGPGHANPPDGGRGGAADGMGWKFDGWVRWLSGLRGVYERRMNRMCSILESGRFALKQQSFTLAADEDSDWAVVSKVQMYDFSWPSAGMFIWLEFQFETHPLWGMVGGQKLSEKLWVWLSMKPYLVLAAPGAMFAPTEEIAREKGWRFVRLCFAAVDEDEVEEFAERFANGVEMFWRLRKRSELDGIEDDEDVEGSVESEAAGVWMC